MSNTMRSDVEHEAVAPHAPGPASLSTTKLPIAAGLGLVLSACGGGGETGGSPQPDPQPNPQPNPSSQEVPQMAPVAPVVMASTTSVDARTGLTLMANLPGSDTPEPRPGPALSATDAARLLTQATFGIRSPQEVSELQQEGVAHWLWRQWQQPAASHVSYLDLKRRTQDEGRATEEMAYEAIWRQWLFEDGQLRGRVAFALSQIMVVSNIAPDLKPYAMAAYMDTLNRHAFGSFRALLEAVTLHPTMGYYLDMLRSEKANPDTGSHPNENYAREVLQLFSIGLVKLNADGSTRLDANRQPIPTYNEDVVKGFARAFSGWSFGGQGQDARMFDEAEFDADINWVQPMVAFADRHERGTKQLLDGVVLPADQTPEKDLADALDNICAHPNVGPFIGRQLIQRLVTSNPSAAYIARVSAAFADNGQGVRGDLRAVIQAILTDPEARGDDAPSRARYGKLREPVIRFANMLRAFNATTPDAAGRTGLHYLDSADDGLGQSPLLAPSVFNFFAPGFRPAGPLAQAGMAAPEFQITNETTIAGSLNTFKYLFDSEGYGWDDASRLTLNVQPWQALATQPEALVSRMNLMLCNGQMGDVTRQRLLTLIRALPNEEWGIPERIKQAFTVLSASPDFVVQK